VEDLLAEIAAQVQRKFYGKYRGFVVDAADPERRARLRLQVPSVLGEQTTGWALPCLPYGGHPNEGLFTVPSPDAQVWVEFEEGEISQPIWTGTFWQQRGDPPAEAGQPEQPTTRVLRTAAGHVLQFDDAEDAEGFRLAHPAGATITIDAQGTVVVTDADDQSISMDAEAGEITVTDANGNSIRMLPAGTTITDANGGTVEMTSSGITVKAATVVLKGDRVALGGSGGEPVIKGQSFLTLFATHVHPTGTGPSGPPVPQGETSALSIRVTTS
jgi:uncharacterized protein involved in type VI secretion and phage assembly